MFVIIFWSFVKYTQNARGDHWDRFAVCIPGRVSLTMHKQTIWCCHFDKFNVQNMYKLNGAIDTSKCDSLSCFGSCLKKFEIDAGSLEAAMAQPFFMVTRMQLGATLGLETRCQFIFEQFSCDGFGRAANFSSCIDWEKSCS